MSSRYLNYNSSATNTAADAASGIRNLESPMGIQRSASRASVGSLPYGVKGGSSNSALGVGLHKISNYNDYVHIMNERGGGNEPNLQWIVKLRSYPPPES